MTEINFLKEFSEDKSNWPDGPWKDEPDRLEWIDEESGYTCLILRNLRFGGTLCGYVELPRGHPYYDKNFSCPEKDTPEIEVHGGVTYHGTLSNIEKNDKMYVGFDCCHYLDYSPYEHTKLFFECLKKRNPKGQYFLDEFKKDNPFFFEKDRRELGWIYKNINYVKEECARLAKQLKDLEK